LPADRESAPLFRRILSRWLVERGASEDEHDAILLACAEACSNAIEHAYPPERREFCFEASDTDGELSFQVRDWGSWRPPRGKNRGRGIRMMEALTDSVEIQDAEPGTKVMLRHRLRREDAA
jgi:anti-sigma regulatory factor (Ser/Thr protein kinase)